MKRFVRSPPEALPEIRNDPRIGNSVGAVRGAEESFVRGIRISPNPSPRSIKVITLESCCEARQMCKEPFSMNALLCGRYIEASADHGLTHMDSYSMLYADVGV